MIFYFKEFQKKLKKISKENNKSKESKNRKNKNKNKDKWKN